MDTQVRDFVCSFDNLYKALKKCRHNVIWKDSVATFLDKGLLNCLRLRESILDESYEINSYSIFYIHDVIVRNSAARIGQAVVYTLVVLLKIALSNTEDELCLGRIVYNLCGPLGNAVSGIQIA